MSADEFEGTTSRRTAPSMYGPSHPVPTVQKYEERQHHRQDIENSQPRPEIKGNIEPHGTVDKIKQVLHLDGPSKGGNNRSSGDDQPYASKNRNVQQPAPYDDQQEKKKADPPARDGEESQNQSSPQEIPRKQDLQQNARQKRKAMKNMNRDREGRVVTDPVTHLPVTISDFTEIQLKNTPENLPPADSQHRSARSDSKNDEDLYDEKEEIGAKHQGMKKLFPPPSFDIARDELRKAHKRAISFGLVAILFLSLVELILSLVIGRRAIAGKTDSSRTPWISLPLSFLVLSGVVGIGGAAIWGVRAWLDHRVNDIWEDLVWEGARNQEKGEPEPSIPESTQWLNSILASVWPLINPDLFTSLADTLEDVMQASLPKLVRMISVEDLGQGSESIRILGIRWLPTGAAAKNVSVDGKVKSGSENKASDRKVSGEGEVDADTKSSETGNKQDSDDDNPHKDEKGEAGDEENIAEGMEAEQGDFLNLEVAFSYRASVTGKGIKNKVRNAHLYLAFYLPGAIRFPVWVELKGIVGIMRMRLQLHPDPPFFALCTLTLLGQPKAKMSCVPLTKRGLNIMDLPIISSFVQSSIDAALAEYVAPKSLTIDLKDMLVGDDFKKDTGARGVILVKISRARGFKEGDGNFGGFKKGSSDAYVSVGWAKFGKPIWSTRVILEDMEPIWEETAFLLVTPQELNAEERLRVQIWDSDRASADDDLGRIEVDLRELMSSHASNARMQDREDGLMSMDADMKMPGTLIWSVGYYPKLRIQRGQLAKQTAEPDIDSVQQLKDKVAEESEKKLREAKSHNESQEINQQKAQDLKVREDNLIISSGPPDDYPTGIFSIQVHNITGLEYSRLNKNTKEGSEGDDMEEGSGDLPSSYCTIIFNHQKVFKTRTKPKNTKPFFNAGVERTLRDWKTTEVIVSVRDSRVHEEDPLLGIVYLPLGYVFRKRSQINDTFPLVGGIGYGRLRISMVFRSVQLQLPRNLLGWDYGTVEITGPIKSKDISPALKGLRLKIRSSVNHGKANANEDSNRGTRWIEKKDRRIRLAVRKRYASCIVFEFRRNSLARDKTSGFAVLWLREIPDEEETTVRLTVWGGKADMKRAESNVCESLDGEDVEKLGIIEVPLKFWRGLSCYHKRLASRNPDLADVLEVLDTAGDSKEIQDSMAADWDEDSSDSDGGPNNDYKNQNSVDATNSQSGRSKTGEAATNETSDDHDKHNQESGGRDPLDQIKDYKDHSKQLHRQHRGIMQWKGVRTANWMKSKVHHGRDHVTDRLNLKDREPGIETEV